MWNVHHSGQCDGLGTLPTKSHPEAEKPEDRTVASATDPGGELLDPRIRSGTPGGLGMSQAEMERALFGDSLSDLASEGEPELSPARPPHLPEPQAVSSPTELPVSPAGKAAGKLRKHTKSRLKTRTDSIDDDVHGDQLPVGKATGAGTTMAVTNQELLVADMLLLEDPGDELSKEIEQYSTTGGASSAHSPRQEGSQPREVQPDSTTPGKSRKSHPTCQVRLVRCVEQPDKERSQGRPHTKTESWVTTETRRQVRDLVDREGTSCLNCGYKTSWRKVTLHCKQHFIRIFCGCGFQSASRDSIYTHQKQAVNHRKHSGVFESDAMSYPDMLSDLGWEMAPEFGPLCPHHERDWQPGHHLFQTRPD